MRQRHCRYLGTMNHANLGQLVQDYQIIVNYLLCENLSEGQVEVANMSECQASS